MGASAAFLKLFLRLGYFSEYFYLDAGILARRVVLRSGFVICWTGAAGGEGSGSWNGCSIIRRV